MRLPAPVFSLSFASLIPNVGRLGYEFETWQTQLNLDFSEMSPFFPSVGKTAYYFLVQRNDPGDTLVIHTMSCQNHKKLLIKWALILLIKIYKK